jgi:hypothetical protein
LFNYKTEARIAKYSIIAGAILSIPYTLCLLGPSSLWTSMPMALFMYIGAMAMEEDIIRRNQPKLDAFQRQLHKLRQSR